MNVDRTVSSFSAPYHSNTRMDNSAFKELGLVLLREQNQKVINKIFHSIVNQSKIYVKKLTGCCLQITCCTGMSSSLHF